MATQCHWCGKLREEDQLSSVLVPMLDGETMKEFLAPQLRCETCRLCVGPYRLLFQAIDGPSYPEENRPPFWHNEVPFSKVRWRTSSGQILDSEGDLPYHPDRTEPYFLDHESMSLETFPLIEDFEILLERLTTIYETGAEETSDAFVWMFSPSCGYLAHALDCFARDLCQPQFILPHGTLQDPLQDLDQGWNILLFEDELFVYVLTGNWETSESFETWFKVKKKRYYREWQRAVRRCHELQVSQR